MRALLDPFISAEQYRLRNGEPDRLRCLEIDHELKRRRLQHGQVGGFGAVDDFPT